MHNAHDSVVACHLGIDKAIASIRNMFTWDEMIKAIAEYIRSGDQCQKPTPSKPIGLLQPLKFPAETGSM
jgi:Integrase zinc binding domain